MDRDPVIVKLSTPEDSKIKALAKALLPAFFELPEEVYLYPDERRRREVLPSAFEFIIRLGLKYGVVYASEERDTGELNGFVVLVKSDKTVEAKEAIRTGVLPLIRKQGLKSFWRDIGLEQELEAAEREVNRRGLLPDEYYRAWILGVAAQTPNHFTEQGRIGVALAQAVIEHEQLRDQTIYATNFYKHSRVFFVQRLGFKPVLECEPTRGPKFVSLVLDRGQTVFSSEKSQRLKNYDPLPVYRPPHGEKNLFRFIGEHIHGKRPR